ncbi:MAG: NusG domain II-containing protein [Spirochaetia bacterium]|nr:NusG domain II-containing protein [Spirochaetia bacterium]
MNRSRLSLIGDSLILLLCILAILAISSRTLGSGSGYVQVQTETDTYRYSLSVNREVHVQGPLGDTHIIIEDGEAHIHDSACPTKSCTFQRPISSARAWIACLPNKVLLTIVGENAADSEVDDVAN